MGELPKLGVMAFGRGRAQLDLAREAEQRGFAALWTADGNGGDALTAAGAVAAATTHTQIGTAVALRVRSPLQVVFSSALIDELTGGRFVFGVGAGPVERMESWHGITHGPAIGRMREYITLVRKLWESSPATPITFEGRFYSVKNYGRPVAATHPLPIYLGCSGAQMTRLAGEICDGIIVHVLHSRKMIEDQIRPNLEAGAKKAGRSLDTFQTGIGLFTAIDGDHDVAVNRARRQVLWAMTVPYNPPLLELAGFPGVAEEVLGAIGRGDRKAALAALSDELVQDLTLCGTPAEVRQQLAEWAKLADFITLNGVGAYMNVVPEEWRLPFEEVERNRQAMWDLMPLTR